MSDGKDATDLPTIGMITPDISPLTPEQKAELMKKLQVLGAVNKDLLETLAPKVRRRVDTLREIQSKHDELEAKFFEERATLEAKYQKLYEPLYSKRCEIVTGVVEVEDITEAEDEAPVEKKDGKGVPDFWLNAMKKNEILIQEVRPQSRRDEVALKYLKDIKWCRIDDPKGFMIEFLFDTNPFFKNSVLTKTYHMIDEDEPILEKAIGTEIQWHPGMCLTEKVLKKKPKKGSKNTKPITEIQDRESFKFFSPPQVPDDEEIDEDTAEQLQNLMEQDYDIGSTIRDKIIPHAVSWYTGEAAECYEVITEVEYADKDKDDEEDDKEDEHDDEDEDEEDNDDADDEKSGRAAAGVGQQGDRPSECKHQ